MILYELDMGAAPSSACSGDVVELEKGDELGMFEDVDVSEASDVDEEEAGVEEEEAGVEEEEGVDEVPREEEVGIADRVVGRSPVTVMNDPEAAGAFMNVAEDRGRGVEARWRQ